MEIHKREEYDMEFIKSLIANEVEESINIDFKASGALSKAEPKKKEMSKDVSAFANSNGGIIIYGLNENNHKADSFSFIDGNEFSKEWLEMVISSSIQRNIPNLKIFPIRNRGKIEETIYVVQIPESTEAPHICIDKKFYKRYDFQSKAMEEYEVRNLYGRKIKSKLLLSGYSISHIETNDNKLKLHITTGVLNTGDTSETNYKINAYVREFEPNFCELNWARENINYSCASFEDRSLKVSNFGTAPIYPDEKIDLLRFNLEITKGKAREYLEKTKLEFRLYYPNGEDVITVNLNEINSDLIAKNYYD